MNANPITSGPMYDTFPTLTALTQPFRKEPSGKPVETIYRLATMEDVPKLAILASLILRTSASHLIRYPQCGVDDHIRFQGELFAKAILSNTKVLWIAVDEDNDPLGYLMWTRLGMGDTDDPGTVPSVTLPTGADMKVHNRYAEQEQVWDLALLGKYGPHYKGNKLGVVPDSRRRGIATGLCKILATEAEQRRVPVFLECTYYNMPFYDRYASQNGYRTKTHGNVPLDDRSTLAVLRVQFLKAASLPPPPPKELPMRSASPEWENY